MFLLLSPLAVASLARFTVSGLAVASLARSVVFGLVLASLPFAAAPSVILAQEGPRVGVESVVSDGYERREGIDVLHYDLALELPAVGDTIVARAVVFYEVMDPLEEVVLDFGPLVVDSVSVDGRALPFEHAGGRLVVATPGEVGDRSEVVVWYHGRPVDGLILKENRHGDFAIFADNWADRAHLWFPGVDHPSDKATVSFDVTAPNTMEVIANGTLVGVEELGGGRTRTRWAETAEIPTYCMVIGATDFAITTAGEFAGVEVSHWTFPADSSAGEAAFSRSVEIAAFYDSLFGPFPYEKLAHVQSATKFGGMENASAIFYSEETIGTALEEGAGTEGPVRDELTSLVAHETVHMWFGDAVTEADWNHLWLSEGFATYFAAVFFEFNGSSTGRGEAELARRMKADRETVIEFFRETGRPIYSPGPGPGEYEELLNANNYPKGAWVLHMLRRELGDEAFFRGIRAYYAALRDGTAWTADFERIMERQSGEDLGWFFAQWVGRPGHPVLALDRTSVGETTTLRLAQVQRGEPFRFTVDLELEVDGTSRRETLVVDGPQTEIEVAGSVGSVEIDPDGWLLFERR